MGARRPGDMPTGTAKLRPAALSSSLAPDPLCSWNASDSGASFAGISITASWRLPVPELASALVTRPVLALLLLPGGGVIATGASHFAGEVR